MSGARLKNRWVRIVISEVEPAVLEALKSLPGVEIVVASSREELGTVAQEGDLAVVGARRLAQLETLRVHVDKAAGHDLRSPLHAISMGVSLLANDPPTPEQTDVLRRIDKAIDRISDNLDKLVELSS